MTEMITGEAKWLLHWFERRGPVPGKTVVEQLQTNYFEAGLIDSLGVVDLIFDVEQHFSIQFNELHFQERRFSTVQGLSEIIAELSRDAH